MKSLFVITLGLFVMALTSLSHAADNNEVLLIVSGLIAKTNSADKKTFAFTFDDLQKLGNKNIQATNIYNGKAMYTGPLIRDVLRTAGVKLNAKSVIFVGLDDYQVRVPISDLDKWDVIVAHTVNDQRMVIETKGPLWVMYPLDQDPVNLANTNTSAKLVWNLLKIIVK